MPTYEYQCKACGHQLEVFQKMSEQALTTCPACQQSTLQKLVSAASFQLKGTGWYVTDFRNQGQPEKKPTTGNTAAETKSEKAAGSEGTTETKKDTKDGSASTSTGTKEG